MLLAGVGEILRLHSLHPVTFSMEWNRKQDSVSKSSSAAQCEVNSVFSGGKVKCFVLNCIQHSRYGGREYRESRASTDQVGEGADILRFCFPVFLSD